jgi:hypothetical protein
LYFIFDITIYDADPGFGSWHHIELGFLLLDVSEDHTAFIIIPDDGGSMVL